MKNKRPYKMTDTAQKVMSLLVQAADENDAVVVSMTGLAKSSEGMQKTDIRRGLRRLQELNLIKRELRPASPGQSGRWGPSLYRIVHPPEAGDNKESPNGSPANGQAADKPQGRSPPSRLHKFDKALLDQISGFTEDERQTPLTIQRVEETLNCSKASSQRAVVKLFQMGYLTRLGENGPNGLHRYAIVSAALPEAPMASAEPALPAGGMPPAETQTQPPEHEQEHNESNGASPTTGSPADESVEGTVSVRDVQDTSGSVDVPVLEKLLQQTSDIAEKIGSVEQRLARIEQAGAKAIAVDPWTLSRDSIRAAAKSMLEQTRMLLRNDPQGSRIACVVAHAAAAWWLNNSYDSPPPAVRKDNSWRWDTLCRLQEMALNRIDPIPESHAHEAFALAQWFILWPDEAA